MIKLDDELKQAISNLNNKEKDKLIFRLLRKDAILADKLKFELIGTNSVEEEREELHQKIEKSIDGYFSQIHHCGHLLMELREFSGQITRHVKVTKDKTGEITLNNFIVKRTLELKKDKIINAKSSKSYTLCIYIINKIFKQMMLIQKQHEDFYLDYKADIKEIGLLMGEIPILMHTAIQNGLDVNWLLQFNFPKNVEGVYKQLREDGFLR